MHNPENEKFVAAIQYTDVPVSTPLAIDGAGVSVIVSIVEGALKLVTRVNK